MIVIVGLIKFLVEHFASHVMCRKPFLQKCWELFYKMFTLYKFEHYCLSWSNVTSASKHRCSLCFRFLFLLEHVWGPRRSL